MLSVTATELPRLMACNGSRLMVGFKPTIGTDDTVRDEGNAAHWLIEQVHKGIHQIEELVDRKAPNGIFITGEMIDHVSDYLKTIHPNGHIEYETSFKGANWEVRSRADYVFFDCNKLYISDFKYGWSIVNPEKNWTLIAHAVGFCLTHQVAPETIHFTIFQPRSHTDEGIKRDWVINYQELLQFYNELNLTLSNPNDVLNTGENCKNCPALATCPAARKAELNGIDASEIAFENELTNAALSFKLDQLDRAIKVLKQNYEAYEEIALHRVQKGEIVNNYAIDNQLSNRGWKQNVTPELMKILTGKDLTKKQLITPAQAEREGVSKEIVAAWTERFNKGIKLTRIDVNKKVEKLLTKKGN